MHSVPALHHFLGSFVSSCRELILFVFAVGTFFLMWWLTGAHQSFVQLCKPTNFPKLIIRVCMVEIIELVDTLRYNSADKFLMQNSWKCNVKGKPFKGKCSEYCEVFPVLYVYFSFGIKEALLPIFSRKDMIV